MSVFFVLMLFCISVNMSGLFLAIQLDQQEEQRKKEILREMRMLLDRCKEKMENILKNLDKLSNKL